MVPTYVGANGNLTVYYDGKVILQAIKVTKGYVNFLRGVIVGPYDGKTFRYDDIEDKFVEIVPEE